MADQKKDSYLVDFPNKDNYLVDFHSYEQNKDVVDFYRHGSSSISFSSFVSSCLRIVRSCFSILLFVLGVPCAVYPLPYLLSADTKPIYLSTISDEAKSTMLLSSFLLLNYMVIECCYPSNKQPWQKKISRVSLAIYLVMLIPRVGMFLLSKDQTTLAEYWSQI